eukprot:1194353-Prorocentrum_minimum.AAC.7
MVNICSDLFTSGLDLFTCGYLRTTAPHTTVTASGSPPSLWMYSELRRIPGAVPRPMEGAAARNPGESSACANCLELHATSPCSTCPVLGL